MITTICGIVFAVCLIVCGYDVYNVNRLRSAYRRTPLVERQKKNFFSILAQSSSELADRLGAIKSAYQSNLKLAEQVIELEMQLEERNQENDLLIINISNINEELSWEKNISQSHMQKNEKVTEIESENNRLKKQIISLEKDKDFFCKMTEKFRGFFENASGEAEKLQQELTKEKETSADLKAENQKLSEKEFKLSGAKLFHKISQQHRQAKQKNNELVKLCKDFGDQHFADLEKINELKRFAFSLQNERESLSSERNSLFEELESSVQNIFALQKENNQLKSMQERYNNALGNCQNQRAVLEKRVKELEARPTEIVYDNLELVNALRTQSIQLSKELNRLRTKKLILSSVSA